MGQLNDVLANARKTIERAAGVRTGDNCSPLSFGSTGSGRGGDGNALGIDMTGESGRIFGGGGLGIYPRPSRILGKNSSIGNCDSAGSRVHPRSQ